MTDRFKEILHKVAILGLPQVRLHPKAILLARPVTLLLSQQAHLISLIRLNHIKANPINHSSQLNHINLLPIHSSRDNNPLWLLWRCLKVNTDHLMLNLPLLLVNQDNRALLVDGLMEFATVSMIAKAVVALCGVPVFVGVKL